MRAGESMVSRVFFRSSNNHGDSCLERRGGGAPHGGVSRATQGHVGKHQGLRPLYSLRAPAHSAKGPDRLFKLPSEEAAGALGRESHDSPVRMDQSGADTAVKCIRTLRAEAGVELRIQLWQ